MSYFTLRFVAMLLTFGVGVTAATVWLYRQSYPPRKPSSALDSSGPTVETPPPAEPESPCRWSRQIEQALAQFSGEYSEIEKRPSVEKLVALDGKVRRFFDSRPEYYPCGEENKFWKDEHQKLGVHAGQWGVLVYTGELLATAHRMNPRSEFRSHTLFSTIMGVRPEHGFGEMPDIKAAHQYEREFPDGPFIEETLSTIADFNKDLYMVLRDDLNDYKYGCFKPHIDESPRPRQASRARRKAISYYEKVLSINPSNARARGFLEEVSSGSVKGWSFCAD